MIKLIIYNALMLKKVLEMFNLLNTFINILFLILI